MTKKALLIGIDYFNNPTSQLRGCINDINNMRGMLIDAYNYLPANITMLRDDVKTPSLQPTFANILNNLKSLALQSSNLNEIWIHYSGHGSQIQDVANNDSIFRPKIDDLLVPLDYASAGYITDIQLLSIIKTIKCRCILLFDSCNSGTICALPWTFNYVSPTQYSRTLINDVSIENPNIFVLSGCRDNQTSADVTNNSGRTYFGAFTNAFLEVLRLNMHNVPFLVLYRDICVYLSNQGFSQIPVLSTTIGSPTATIVKSGPHITSITNNNASSTPMSSNGVTAAAVVKKNMRAVIGL
uniref:Peptidase C14 caspase domain-containing protein n=1 Tax=viral metagenome TaxID=1070528 RepID=A0A6C0DQ68_9ZZZZ